jgi:hypothetical protein
MSHPQLREWVPACRQGFTPTPLTEGGSSKVTLAKLIGFIPFKKVEVRVNKPIASPPTIISVTNNHENRNCSTNPSTTTPHNHA